MGFGKDLCKGDDLGIAALGDSGLLQRFGFRFGTRVKFLADYYADLVVEGQVLVELN